MEMRGKTISYSSFIKKEIIKKKIVTEMNRLEENYEQNICLINEKKGIRKFKKSQAYRQYCQIYS